MSYKAVNYDIYFYKNIFLHLYLWFRVVRAKSYDRVHGQWRQLFSSAYFLMGKISLEDQIKA